jgi:glyoxylase-like metal-dependent hydrolase (beta-lactamase superfamily II)
MIRPANLCHGLWLFQSAQSGPHYPCNGYILESGGTVCLIDPPADLTREVVLAATGKNGVAHIFLTHVQAEHGTGIPNFPEAAVHVPSGDEYLCRGHAAYEAMVTQWEEPWEWEARGNFQGHLGGAKNERPLDSPVSLAASLHAGEAAFGFEVVATPGHGKNAVTLLATIDKMRVAFCGDLIYGHGQVWNWFDADWDYGNQSGQTALRRSAQTLAGLSPDLLCPAHGPVIREPEKSLALLDRHLAAVLEARAGEEPRALIYGTELFTFSLQERGDHRGDWNFHGPMTVKGNSLFWLLRRSPGDKATLGGLQNKVLSVSRLDNGEALPFAQNGTRVQIGNVPATDETGLWPALRIECDTPPVVYQSGGLRIPKAPHPHYDPCPSDIAH